jgi:magnesium transporter
MISRYMYHGLTWVDIESPNREELLHISEEFGLPKMVEEGLFSITADPKTELYETFIQVVLHFPQEVNFIVGKNFIVTIHYETIAALHEYAALFENKEMFDHHKKVSDGGSMFMEMMKQLYKASSKELKEIASRIPKIEHAILNDRQEKMITAIFQTNRRLLDFKRAIMMHDNILHSYETASKHFFGETYSYYALTILSELHKVTAAIEGHREVLKALQHTNDSLLSVQSTAVLKKCMYFILLAMAVITISIFLWH